MLFLKLLAFVIVYLSQSTEAENILAVYTVLSPSHYVLAGPLLRELAESGHNVTVLSFKKSKNLPINYNEIYIELSPGLQQQIEAFKRSTLENTDANQLYVLTEWARLSKDSAIETMNDRKVKDFMNSGTKIDLIIMETAAGDAFVGFRHFFKAPVVGVATVRSQQFVQAYTGTPLPSSYLPNVMLELPHEMNFLQRVSNTVNNLVLDLVVKYLLDPPQKEAYDQVFPDPKPDFDTAKRDAMSLVLMNSHISLDGAQPLLTNIIEVGGMQIATKPNELPEDIKQFLDGAKEGVVYFSFGTNLEASYMTPEKRAAIVNTLNNIKEKVIWKWNHPESIKHVKPGKFFTSKWLPQSDLLAHPNVKLFITHGGLLGTTEAVYHAVPIVGVPIFADQQPNVEHAVAKGFGVRIDYGNLTEYSLTWAVNSVLQNEDYKLRAKVLSERYRDRPQEALATAKFWVEYAIRHYGARFMRSPAVKLNFFQYYNFDVYGFLVTIVVLLILMVVKLFKLVCSKLCGRTGEKYKQS